MRVAVLQWPALLLLVLRSPPMLWLLWLLLVFLSGTGGQKLALELLLRYRAPLLRSRAPSLRCGRPLLRGRLRLAQTLRRLLRAPPLRLLLLEWGPAPILLLLLAWQRTLRRRLGRGQVRLAAPRLVRRLGPAHDGRCGLCSSTLRQLAGRRANRLAARLLVPLLLPGRQQGCQWWLVRRS
jgi:hypothetical protein